MSLLDKQEVQDLCEHTALRARKWNGVVRTFVNTLHCALENGMDLYVNERQMIRHYHARSTEERRRMPNRDFFTLRGAYVNLHYISMLYTHSILKSTLEHDGGV